MKTRLNNLLCRIQDADFDYDIEIGKIHNDIKSAQQSGDESRANQLWAIQSIVKIHKMFVEVFELLKNSVYYDAWCKAEQVEIYCNNLRRNFPDTFPIVDSIYNSTIRLQALYPYRLFGSYEVVFKQVRCSICNQIRSIRSDCGHRSGYVYNGELCFNIVEESELISISIVDNPVHKYAVCFPSIDNNQRKDNYDYLLVNGLMKYWQKPFQRWAYNIVHTHKSIKEFPGLKEEDDCPCDSGNKYGECCKSDPEGIKHKVYQFIVEA